MHSSQTAHPIFTFADGEMGPISNTLIRSIERFSGQPKIRKLYFDYVEEDRPYASFWADALDKLGIGWGGTTADGRGTVEAVYCLGLCACAPAAMIGDRLIGRADAARIDAELEGAA